MQEQTAATRQEQTAATGPAANQTGRFRWQNLIGVQELGILIIFLLWCAFLTIATDTFLTSTNIINMLRAFSWIAIAAFGECLVILTAGIDLSGRKRRPELVSYSIDEFGPYTAVRMDGYWESSVDMYGGPFIAFFVHDRVRGKIWLIDAQVRL